MDRQHHLQDPPTRPQPRLPRLLHSQRWTCVLCWYLPAAPKERQEPERADAFHLGQAPLRPGQAERTPVLLRLRRLGTDNQQRILKARFILKWSKNEDGSPRAKARLIVQGFNDPDITNSNLARTSPTLTRLARSLIVSLAANKKWQMFTSDISTAFLQGKEHSEERTLWVRLPEDARAIMGIQSSRVVMRLKKPMYGL